MAQSSWSSNDLSSQPFVADSVLFGMTKALLLGSIGFYRLLLRPLIGPACRFAPSCSHYGEQAIRAHGPFVGTRIALRRLMRCHPWNPGGYDPVPERSV